MRKPSKVRTKIFGYKFDYTSTVRLGEYEKAMLERLIEKWNCSESEAIRRCIVFTFSKYVANINEINEENLINALSVALSGLRKTHKETG